MNIWNCSTVLCLFFNIQQCQNKIYFLYLMYYAALSETEFGYRYRLSILIARLLSLLFHYPLLLACCTACMLLWILAAFGCTMHIQERTCSVTASSHWKKKQIKLLITLNPKNRNERCTLSTNWEVFFRMITKNQQSKNKDVFSIDWPIFIADTFCSEQPVEKWSF